jgi:hypothetical protein
VLDGNYKADYSLEALKALIITGGGGGGGPGEPQPGGSGVGSGFKRLLTAGKHSSTQ